MQPALDPAAEESDMTISSEDVRATCSLDANYERSTSVKRKGVSTNSSEDDSWKTVTAKRKIKITKRDADRNEGYEISLTSTEILPKQFGLAKMFKNEGISNIHQVKYVNPYKVLVRFENEESANILCQSKVFNTDVIKARKTMEVYYSYGVIKNVDIDLTEEEIMSALSSEQAIISVKRLKRRNTLDGRWELGESVRICFEGQSLPQYIKIYDVQSIVTSYRYPVTQCSQCWRFGHTIKMCPSLKVICPKCSKSHANCETTEFRCNNCTGRHMAMAKICPVYLKERNIRYIMSENNCSYKRAQSLYVPPPSTPTLDLTRLPRLPTARPLTRLGTKPRAASPLAVLAPTVAATSYANVVKEGSNTRKKESEGRKKRKKKTTKEKEDDIYCESSSEPGDDSRIPNREKKEPVFWQVLFKKLKDKLLEANVSWEDKIKSCVGIVFEGVLSFVWQYMADKPGCNLIQQLWITATQTAN